MKTLEQIDQKYTELCAELGDIEIQKGMLEHKKNEIIKKISVLAKEKHEAMNKSKEQEQ